MNDSVMLTRLSNIDVIALDAAVASGAAGERAYRLLQNRQDVAPDHLPWLLITTHRDSKNEHVSVEELAAAGRMAARVAPFCHEVKIVLESGRTETATKALALHRASFPAMTDQERKERVLLLGRRGGKGKPEFIAPFTGGTGTTCGAWTPVIAYQKGKTAWIAGTRPKGEEQGALPIRGFLRGNYAQGVCPAECSFCYLRGLQGMGVKQIMLNLEEVTSELDLLPRGSVVNWAELGGPVEQDPFFVDAHGNGSLVQQI